MNAQIKSTLLFCAAILVSSFCCTPMQGQTIFEEHAATVANYFADDVVAIAYVDLESLDLEQLIEAAAEIGFDRQSSIPELVEAAPMMKSEIEKLKAAGINCGFAFLRMSDIGSQTTSWVFPVEVGKDVRLAAQALGNSELGLVQNLVKEVEGGNGAVLAAGTKSQIKSLREDSPTEKRSIDDAAKAVGAGSIGLIVTGSKDSRRPVQELFPKLPEPFSAWTGDLIANKTKWIGASLSLNKNLGAELAIEAADEKSAGQQLAALGSILEFAKTYSRLDPMVAQGDRGFLLESLTPEQSGNRVSVSTGKLMTDKPRLARALAPTGNTLRANAARVKRANKIRQLALAMLNYEAANRHFPTQAIVDANGKPLLSWRVMVLPWIEQNGLYKKFKLDEPWDSEHNLKLIEQMPDTYADASFANNKAGKTIFQVPTGKRLMFDGGTKRTFSDLIDGSSNTMLIVTVAQEHAVPWTKPADWEVDLANVLAKLKEDGRTEVEMAVCDGSSHSLPLKPWDGWKRLIQHNDAEVVILEDFKNAK